MPQMAPILWLPLFILIVMALIILKSSIYFSFKPSSLLNNMSTMTKNNFNWKW